MGVERIWRRQKVEKRGIKRETKREGTEKGRRETGEERSCPFYLSVTP